MSLNLLGIVKGLLHSEGGDVLAVIKRRRGMLGRGRDAW